MFELTPKDSDNWRLQADKCAVLIVDVQEKLIGHIDNNEKVQKRVLQLTKGAKLLGVPVYITEQYPQGLGSTTKDLLEAVQGGEGESLFDKPFEKTRFSADGIVDQIESRKIILAGIETHICVRQTAYDLREKEKEVILAADATGSRDPENKDLALAELRQDGVIISSVEALLFELMVDSDHEKFKEVSELIK